MSDLARDITRITILAREKLEKNEGKLRKEKEEQDKRLAKLIASNIFEIYIKSPLLDFIKTSGNSYSGNVYWKISIDSPISVLALPNDFKSYHSNGFLIDINKSELKRPYVAKMLACVIQEFFASRGLGDYVKVEDHRYTEEPRSLSVLLIPTKDFLVKDKEKEQIIGEKIIFEQLDLKYSPVVINESDSFKKSEAFALDYLDTLVDIIKKSAENGAQSTNLRYRSDNNIIRFSATGRPVFPSTIDIDDCWLGRIDWYTLSHPFRQVVRDILGVWSSRLANMGLRIKTEEHLMEGWEGFDVTLYDLDDYKKFEKGCL